MANAALSPANTISQCINSVVPIPTAGPQTAAIIGLGNSAIANMNWNTGASICVGGYSKKSAISLPAVKMFSAPWSTATRTCLSFAALRKISANWLYMARFKEFLRASRLKVMVKTPSSVCCRMSLMFGSLWKIKVWRL